MLPSGHTSMSTYGKLIAFIMTLVDLDLCNFFIGTTTVHWSYDFHSQLPIPSDGAETSSIM